MKMARLKRYKYRILVLHFIGEERQTMSVNRPWPSYVIETNITQLTFDGRQIVPRFSSHGYSAYFFGCTFLKCVYIVGDIYLFSDDNLRANIFYYFYIFILWYSLKENYFSSCVQEDIFKTLIVSSYY